jgi:hypothetical protein
VKRQYLTITIVAIGLCLVGSVADAQRIRRWVDDNGVVHYGDRVPPEFANRDRDVLNDQAIAVGFEEGEVTEEERAELDRIAQEEARVRKIQEDASRRDRMLLDTYLTVDDIEQLRDRRIELLESQIKVTEQYLTNLRKRLVQLEREAERYTSDDDEGAGLPPDLALELTRTAASISLYEENLSRTRAEQDSLRQAFASDIDRFVQLKGGRSNL